MGPVEFDHGEQVGILAGKQRTETAQIDIVVFLDSFCQGYDLREVITGVQVLDPLIRKIDLFSNFQQLINRPCFLCIVLRTFDIIGAKLLVSAIYKAPD
jgi:hypothetical protein